VVDVFADDKAAIDAALAKINEIVQEPEVGEVYHGKVKGVVSFGCFVEIMPGREGLLHISEWDWRRIEKMEDEVRVGDEVDVKLIDIDEKNGNLKLSRKVLKTRPERSNDQRSGNHRQGEHGQQSRDHRPHHRERKPE
jgi:polyribonucleotide nucleotidyltransferase